MLTTVEPELTINDPAARYTETNPYLDYQMFYLNGAYNLAFLYQMTGEQAYADRAFYFVNKLCAMDTWVQSAHYFEIIYPRVWPYGVPDDQVSFSYDISVADCAYVVGLVYDWLYPALAKPQRDRIAVPCSKRRSPASGGTTSTSGGRRPINATGRGSVIRVWVWRPWRC